MSGSRPSTPTNPGGGFAPHGASPFRSPSRLPQISRPDVPFAPADFANGLWNSPSTGDLLSSEQLSPHTHAAYVRSRLAPWADQEPFAINQTPPVPPPGETRGGSGDGNSDSESADSDKTVRPSARGMLRKAFRSVANLRSKSRHREAQEEEENKKAAKKKKSFKRPSDEWLGYGGHHPSSKPAKKKKAKTNKRKEDDDMDFVCRGDKSDYERLEALDEVFAPSPNSSPPPPVPPLPAEIQDKRSLGPSFVPPPTPTSYSTPRASVEEGDSGEVPLGLPMPRQRPQIPKSRLSEFVVNDAALPDWAAYKAEATKEDDTAKEQDRQAEDQPSTPASSSSKSSRPPLSRLARELVAERDASEKFGSGSPRQDNDSVGSASSGRPLLQTSPPAPAQPTRTPPKSIIKSRSRIFRRFETSSDDQESLSPESLRAPPPIPPKSPLRAPRRHRSFFNLRGAAASAENVPPVPPLPSQIPPPIRPLPPIPAAPVQTAPARPPPPPPEQRPLMRVQTPIVTGLDSVPQRPRGPIPPPLPLPGPNEPLPPHLVGHPALLSQHLGATMEQARPTTALSSPSDHPGPPVGPHRHVRTHAVSGSADLSPEDLLAHATRRGKFPDGPGADRVRRWI